MWPTLLALSLCSTLAACGSAAANLHTQFNDVSVDAGAMSETDPRLRDPHFYMDEREATPRWMLVTPQPNR
jgi:hypothetical protein